MTHQSQIQIVTRIPLFKIVCGISYTLKMCRKKGSIFSFYYVDDCMIVSHKKETNTSLIESLYNFSKNYVLTDEGDISNYFGVNINKK